jgi:hypothetical protein
VDEFRRLVRQLLDAWDAWMDTDAWSGPEYDALATAVEALRRHLEELNDQA